MLHKRYDTLRTIQHGLRPFSLFSPCRTARAQLVHNSKQPSTVTSTTAREIGWSRRGPDSRTRLGGRPLYPCAARSAVRCGPAARVSAFPIYRAYLPPVIYYRVPESVSFAFGFRSFHFRGHAQYSGKGDCSSITLIVLDPYSVSRNRKIVLGIPSYRLHTVTLTTSEVY